MRYRSNQTELMYQDPEARSNMVSCNSHPYNIPEQSAIGKENFFSFQKRETVYGTLIRVTLGATLDVHWEGQHDRGWLGHYEQGRISLLFKVTGACRGSQVTLKRALCNLLTTLRDILLLFGLSVLVNVIRNQHGCFWEAELKVSYFLQHT